MKTLTQTEIGLLVNVLKGGVDSAKSSSRLDLRNGVHRNNHQLHAFNLKTITDMEYALEIAKRLKPVEVLAKETSKYEPGVDVLIIKDLK